MNARENVRIKVDGLCKGFALEFAKHQGALARFKELLFKGPLKEKTIVLHDVSLEVCSGEVLGIIGRNGSGKSTLLRTIAEIYFPDKGNIFVNGSIIYLDGYSCCLNSRLTLRENIYMIGSLLGLSLNDIKTRFDEIVNFAELNDYVNVKVYKLSSGMAMRLVFSVALYCVKHKALDIVLMDEFFGCGADLNFSQKTIEKVEGMIARGATVLIVSHNLELIQKHCGRVIWLDKGRIVKQGQPAEVIQAYTDADSLARERLAL